MSDSLRLRSCALGLVTVLLRERWIVDSPTNGAGIGDAAPWTRGMRHCERARAKRDVEGGGKNIGE